MLKTKKSVLLGIGLIIVISVFVYYRYAKDIFQSWKQEEVVAKPGMAGTTGAPGFSLKELSAVVSYEASEGKTDSLRFVVVVDKEGAIQEIRTLDAASGEVPEKKKEFNEQINVVLKGKKLSELTTIDKVGTSTLTTNAFNQVLGDLQSGL
ncbi:MAG: hypothetical protein KBA91_01380 [Candidatus Moranbacteria bacterium]|jgi:hypothetical protein|nr:hypothetical protein [Candidatus Moranbacteria bacterium]